MSNKRKTVLKILSFILIFLLPFCITFAVTEFLPAQFDSTYLAELGDKYEMLKEEKGKKIIFVGGSSLPFGLRSDLIEKELGEYKVINLGLYATLGTKFMMDISKCNIKEGDIVILSPELNPQTYSLYFNPTAVLQSCDGFSALQKHLSPSENLLLFYNYFKFAGEKYSYFVGHNAPDPIGIYRHDSFNEFGDIAVEREYNIMNNGVDTTMDIYTDETLISDEFFDYVNKYNKFIKERDAKLYFSFPPVNELAVKSSKKMRDNFEETLGKKVDCPLLLRVENCLIDSNYFYDTNFHLNSSGAIYYSNLVANALKSELKMQNNNDSNTVGGVLVPTPPEVGVSQPPVIVPTTEPIDFKDYKGEPNIDYVDYFKYKKVGASYQIVGVKEEYLDIEEVILPSAYNDCTVTSICDNALSGCVNLKRVHIGTTFKTIENAFNGCVSLEGIYLYEMDGNIISVSRDDLLVGTNRNVIIYIPEGANYMGGYTWINYSDKMEYFKIGG